MRNKAAFFSCLFSLLFALQACIKEAAPNMEADIVGASIEKESDRLAAPTLIEEGEVIFSLHTMPEDHIFAPVFTLSEGATIDPKSGTERDFTHPQIYTVTSEDKEWSKTYLVSFVSDNSPDFYFDFEEADTLTVPNPTRYSHRFYKINSLGDKIYEWSSGNAGYNIVAASFVDENGVVKPEQYPTFQTPDGYKGKGVQLVTRSTGSFTSLAPMAAGNLFIGDFALTFPAIKSPHFGRPYKSTAAPVTFRGYFKYKRGKEFKVSEAPSQLTEDAWNAYALLFEKKDGEEDFLSGDHNFESPRNVAIALLDPKDAVEADDWTLFEIPFEFKYGKTFDPSKEYLYTIVFTSSKEGDKYNGAEGSTLWIDEVELVTE